MKICDASHQSIIHSHITLYPSLIIISYSNTQTHPPSTPTPTFTQNTNKKRNLDSRIKSRVVVAMFTLPRRQHAPLSLPLTLPYMCLQAPTPPPPPSSPICTYLISLPHHYTCTHILQALITLSLNRASFARMHPPLLPFPFLLLPIRHLVFIIYLWVQQAALRWDSNQKITSPCTVFLLM